MSGTVVVWMRIAPLQVMAAVLVITLQSPPHIYRTTSLITQRLIVAISVATVLLNPVLEPVAVPMVFALRGAVAMFRITLVS